MPVLLFMFNMGVELGRMIFVIFAPLLIKPIRRPALTDLDKPAFIISHVGGGLAAGANEADGMKAKIILPYLSAVSQDAAFL